MSVTTSRISQVGLVCLPTDDVDRSIAFYTDTLGFEKRTDTAFGPGYRWVEVYPPSGTAGIALAPPPEGKSAEGTESGIILNTDDIEATHAHLTSAGVDVDAEISRMGDPVPPMFWVRDPQGHSLIVVQS